LDRSCNRKWDKARLRCDYSDPRRVKTPPPLRQSPRWLQAPRAENGRTLIYIMRLHWYLISRICVSGRIAHDVLFRQSANATCAKTWKESACGQIGTFPYCCSCVFFSTTTTTHPQRRKRRPYVKVGSIVQCKFDPVHAVRCLCCPPSSFFYPVY